MKNINTSTEQDLRSRLTEHEFDFDPQAWRSMDKMLNKHNPRRSPLWVTSLLLLTATVTFLSVAWYAPIEPIKSFLVKTFEMEATPVREKPALLPTSASKKSNTTDEQPTINFEKSIPNTPNSEDKIDIIPLPQIGPFDLLQQQEQENYSDENNNAEPIAAIHS